MFAENWFRCGRFVGLQRGLRLDLHACGGAGAPCVLQRASLMVRRSQHKGTGEQFRAGVKFAVERCWLELRLRNLRPADGGADLMAQ
ncbi:hypothetical protein XH94_06530 [Bradyrhizobium zhanjiangense]|uniref:Uncharacterized protein n=1 Tax=Bradyrhizobium zhanjiangense TaxID=1325107 RepID=A0A4Q0SQD8_9BRAD|nr:hypothetical protein XH94_06530 [Bradyrhizobium zhanjiangense]